jgi:hypothetical protein
MSRRRRSPISAERPKPSNAVNQRGGPDVGVLVIDIASQPMTPGGVAKNLAKEWFRDHPHRSHRLRRAIPNEFAHDPAEIWVVVRQTRPGLRVRLPFQAHTPLPSEEAPEHIAHAMYDLFWEAPGKPVLAHELFKRSRAYEVAPDPEDPTREKPLYRH